MITEKIKTNFINNTIIVKPKKIEDKIFYFKMEAPDRTIPESLKSSKDIPSFYNPVRAHTFREFIENFDVDKLDYKALTTKLGDSYTTLTFGEVQEHVKAFGNSLCSMGVKKGDKIGILSENRNEWAISYLAVTAIGAIIVPYDINMFPHELEPVINASDTDIIITSAFFIEKILPIKSELKNIKKIICFDQHQKVYDEINNNEDDDHKVDFFTFNDQIKKIEEKESHSDIPFENYEIIYYHSLLNIGKLLFKNGVDKYSNIDVKPHEICALIHMNGTRFAILTQDGIISNTYFSTDRGFAYGITYNPGDVCLATLPFHHTYPVVGGFLMPLYTYGEAMILPTYKMKDLVNIINDTKTKNFWTVPLIIELIYKELKKSKKKLDSSPFMVAGGARFDEKIAKGLHDMGYIVTQGYGLTEFSPTASANNPINNRINSIGKILNGMEAMIENPDANGNGELLIKGVSMMKGYYKMPEETNKIIDKDGWLHTGDIACMDKDGYLYITGRLKNIIVIKGGKNLFPEKIEKKLQKSAYILKAVIVPRIDYKIGEYPHAYIRPDWEMVNKLERESYRRFSDEEIYDLIQKEINEICKTMAAYNTISSFEIYNKKEPVTSMRMERFMIDDMEVENVPGDSGNGSNDSGSADSNTSSGAELQNREAVLNFLLKKTTELLNISESAFDEDTDLSDFFESSTLLALCSEVNLEYNIGVNPNVFFDYQTIGSFAEYLIKKYGDKLFRDSMGKADSVELCGTVVDEPQAAIVMDISHISVRRAVTREDIEKVYSVRWKGYKKYFTDMDEIKDDCDLDSNSVLLLATDENDNPVGTMRILDRTSGKIELDSFLDVDNVLPENEMPCAEATRLSVPLCRDSFSIKYALMKAYINYCRDNDIPTMLISALPLLAKSYEALLFKDVGENGIYHHELLGGKEHHTYKLSTGKMGEMYQEAAHPLYDLFFLEEHPKVSYLPADNYNYTYEVPEVSGIKMPENLYYSRNHTWLMLQEDGKIRIGIDDFARRLIGKINKIEFPETGKEISKLDYSYSINHDYGILEFTIPIDGTLTSTNPDLINNPNLAVDDPYSDGWLMTITPTNGTEEMKNFLFLDEAKKWMTEDFMIFQKNLLQSAGLEGDIAQDGAVVADDFSKNISEKKWSEIVKKHL